MNDQIPGGITKGILERVSKVIPKETPEEIFG